MRELLSESVDTSYIIESTNGEEEVIVPVDSNIGAIVSARVASGTVVTGVRSKMNRLEALFLELTSKKTNSQGPKTSAASTNSKKSATSKKLSK
jgi:hypothetical protein